MNLDIHHSITYVCLRLAGLDCQDALLAANVSASLFEDVKRARQLPEIMTLFSYVPGNCGLGRNEENDFPFTHRLQAAPDSPVMRDIIRRFRKEVNQENKLYLLGVMLYVYSNSWFNQGFCGIGHAINKATHQEAFDADGQAFFDFRSDYGTHPAGNQCVDTLASVPFVSWSYRNAVDEKIVRDNPSEIMQAANAMYRMIPYFLGQSSSLLGGNQIPLLEQDSLRHLVANIRAIDPDERHKEWIKRIGKGTFSFGAEIARFRALQMDMEYYKAIGGYRTVALSVLKSFKLNQFMGQTVTNVAHRSISNHVAQNA